MQNIYWIIDNNDTVFGLIAAGFIIAAVIATFIGNWIMRKQEWRGNFDRERR